MLLVPRQHDRCLDGAAMDAVTQFLRSEQSLRRAEARPTRGDGEKSVPRAQILRDKRHRGAVAAVARHHHQLFDACARHAFTECRPRLQRHFGRQRQRARIIDVFGGNPDRLQWKEGCGNIVGQ